MSNSNIKEYFKNRKQRVSVFGVSPRFDWIVILSLSTLVLVCGVVYAIYLYININNNTFFEAEQNDQPQVEFETKKSQIQKAVKLLEPKTFDETPLN